MGFIPAFFQSRAMSDLAAADAAAQAAFKEAAERQSIRGFDPRLWFVLNADLANEMHAAGDASEEQRQEMLGRMAAVTDGAEAMFHAAAAEQGYPQVAWERVKPHRKLPFEAFAAGIG